MTTVAAPDADAKVRLAAFPSWPYFAPDEIEAAASVLRSGKVNYWTGEQGRQFEKEFAAFCGCKHAVALANGTVALESALRSLGIGSGDEVITTSRTFIASASCVVAVGARPVIADVDRNSQDIAPEEIRRVITPRTKAVIAVHLAGWPCDMNSILTVANDFGLKVVEDCAQAHGATYMGCPVGSMGHVAAFSFCQDKIMRPAVKAACSRRIMTLRGSGRGAIRITAKATMPYTGASIRSAFAGCTSRSERMGD